jgi:hypothetical protein
MSNPYTPIATTDTSPTHPSPRHQRKRTSISRSSLCRPRISWTCLSVGLVLLLPLSLLLLSVLTYLSPGAEHMRPCLPFSLSRLSQVAHQRLSCEGIAISGTRVYTNSSTITMGDTTEAVPTGALGPEGRLAGFLQSQKELFLQDLRDGKGKGWTVATGNEAGGEWGSSFQFTASPKEYGSALTSWRSNRPIHHGQDAE